LLCIQATQFVFSSWLNSGAERRSSVARLSFSTTLARAEASHHPCLIALSRLNGIPPYQAII
jgi:hypothetical protein